jgi:hypothetical protein
MELLEKLIDLREYFILNKISQEKQSEAVIKYFDSYSEYVNLFGFEKCSERANFMYQQAIKTTQKVN